MSQTFQVEQKYIISSQTANSLVLDFIGEGGFDDVDKTCTGLPKRLNVFSLNILDHSDSSDVANNSETFQVEKEDIISSKSADYRVLDFIGEGTFGKVAKCVNLKTSEIIAIKIHKDSENQVEEVRMIEIIRKLDPEKNNLIRFIDNFFFRDVSCLAFEMLDQSLLDFMINRQEAYRLNEIRPITQQLLVAFKALKSIGVIHSDLKHDNIMLVNHQNQPFRIKLIDFGEAIPTSEVEIGTEKQPLPYRAPEVNLGLPISEAIDMWSLGCIIAEMYFGTYLFPDSSKYCIMKVICHMIAQPGDHLLNAGKFTSNYFIRERKNSPEWRFKTLEEYKEGTGVEPDISECVSDQYSSLDEAIEDYAEEKGRVELKDRMVFVQLLKRLLDLDANSRITPEQALTHSFVTMDHLEEDLDCSPYVADAVRWMTICRLDHTDSSDVANNSETFQVEKEDIISSKSADYQVLDFIGEGGFGKVAKCVNLKTSEIIAIKIHKDSEDQVEEVRMLEIIRKLDPEKNNLIRFIDNFFFRDVSCLAFEMLDQSLYDFMINRQEAYRLNEIRPITQQLLVAFKALKSIGVIHSDLKHDNIMLVNHQNQPFRIKLIDFGEAIPTSEVEIGTEMQPLPYRAPEVNLGLPISEAIDMWSLGCIIAEMYFATCLFPDSSKYCSMKVICHMIAQPGDHLLNAGKFTSNYFIRELKNSPEWRFKTQEEYKEGTGVEPDISECVLDQYSSLDEAIEDYAEEKGRVELKDRMVFVQLLKRLLDLDANSRITPEQALTHSFVTMDHLEEDLDCSPYVADAVRWMTICRLDHTDSSDVANNSETFQVEKEDIISSKSADYRVLDFIGEGGFDDVDKTCTGLPKRLNVFKRMRKRVVSFCRRFNTSNADARPDGFCQDPPITSCRKSSQKDQPITSIAHNSNLGKSEDLGCRSFVKEAGSLSSLNILDHSDSSDVANNSETFQVEKEDIISSKSADYQVLDFIGEGGFGKVAKCVNLKTSETIAIKIHKDSEDQVEEVRMLEIIRKLDPEKNNLIRFIDNFFFRDVSCLAFEMLDQSLYDFMINRQEAYRLNEIRPITQQLLVAFKALKSIGVIHSDLKHDNIMLVNHQNQPFRIKLIDFGEAIPTSEVEIGTEMQPLPYRAPEVNLGLPISEAIDMWSLGCIIAEMYFATCLFPDSSKYCSMKVICHMIAQPGDHLLNAGKFTSNYFIRELKNSPEWRFKTQEEYKEGTGVEPDISECVLDQYSSLDEAIEDYAEEKGRVELKDRMVFVQLLKRLLDLDANSRITPEQALTHSFVTMDHLEEDLDCSPYVADAVRWMTICRLDHSDASDVPVNNHETESSGGEKDMEISCNADARPDSFCQDPPITYCRKSSQKEQPNSNLEKSNIDTTHNKSTPNSNDGAAAAITPTDQGDVDKTCTGLPKRLNVFQRMRRRVVSFFRRFKK
ncbi:hypothetical protein KUCAC02_029142 [Chaenocephalus aceratus]|uniref:Uncharacterized protein n=1 Tax=Chaenocephalus aceratus TaxID=36190 RepID=A0ACB9X4Q5_CHAAC|nr:hypothetical protein KUCAC02_029142 [Chaenocephalus aceratus]